MRKIFLAVLMLFITFSTIFSTNDLAFGHRPYRHHHFGILIAPPLIYWAPYPYFRPWYPPSPPRYYREWIPGHWEWRWNPYWRRWEKVWVPGYWYYRDCDP